MHQTTEKFECDICQKQFTFKYDLNRHKKAHNEMPLNLPCESCEKTFKSRQSLKLHERKHDPSYVEVRNEECEICHKKFRTPRELTSHSIIHTELKPFKCAACDRSFNNCGSLSRHRSSQHGAYEAVFTCYMENCSFKTTSKELLETHIMNKTRDEDELQT